MAKLTGEEQQLEFIAKATDNRPVVFLKLLEMRAKKISPDYPFKGSNAFDWLWSIVASYDDTTQANQDCHAFIKHLGDKLGMDNEALYTAFGEFLESKRLFNAN